MNKRIAKCILFGFLVASAVVIFTHHITGSESLYEDPTDVPHPLAPLDFDLMLVSAVVMLSYFAHNFLTLNQLSCPFMAINIIASFLWGLLAHYSHPILVPTKNLIVGSPQLMLVYLPVLMFNIAFSLDVPIFVKTVPQILVIGAPVFMLTALTFGVVAKMIIEPTWSRELGLLFGLFASPVYPTVITNIYKQHSTKTRQISVIIEGEALLTLVMTDAIQGLVLAYMGDLVVRWYQFVAILLRFVLVGAIHGYLMGIMGRYLLKKMYSIKLSVYMMCFILPFCTYLVAQGYTNGCGSIPVVIMGAMLGMERRTVTKEIEKYVLDFWAIIGFILEAVVCAKCAMTAGVYISPYLSHSDYILTLGIYLLYLVIRFCCFLSFLPVIKRLGYGMDLKNMLVCAWSGLKCPFSLEIVGALQDRHFPVNVTDKFYFHILGLYLLSHLINGSFTYIILEALELTKISTARQSNMNNCMQHIFAKRNRMIYILKHDRLLADTNWAVVLEFTHMKHPYQHSQGTDEEDTLFSDCRYTYCSDCEKDVPLEPTPKEMRDMTREAKMRILKAKKMSYSRQYENGMMSKGAVIALSQAVELAMDSKGVEIDIADLFGRFLEENCFQRWVRRRVEMLSRRKAPVRPPRTYWRRRCYHLVVTRPTLDKFMLIVVFFNLIMVGLDLYFHPMLLYLPAWRPPHPVTVDYALSCLKVAFTLIYLTEFIIKILAYSWIYVCSHGFRTYFKSLQNIFDFVVLLAYVLGCLHDLYKVTGGAQLVEFRRVVDVIQVLRIFRLLRIFQIFYPNFLMHLNRSTDTRMASRYELGKCYAAGETEIMDMLPHMIDNKKIREEIQATMEKDRAVLTQMLGAVQKEKPWVAVTVKTKQAIRTILNGMGDGIVVLNTTGWIDLYEHSVLIASMDELLKKVNSIKKVHPSPPKVIFKEVAWMAEDVPVIDFLFQNVTMKTYEPGEVVFREGIVADGIYIVVTGLLVISYVPDPEVIEAMQEFGRLPIVDYLPGTKYQEPSVDYIVSGNCVGELSTLTCRAYNCVIRADAHSQVYALTRGVLNRAMELSPDPVAGLECRIWKEVSVRIAVSLLLSVPTYSEFSQHQIKEALERAFVPNLSRFKIFTVTDTIEDILLIEGVVVDFTTRDVFTAPCYIPRTVQKLIMPASSLTRIPAHNVTKLLIVPSKDMDEFDVMMTAEETCEMVNLSSGTKCLQHTIQDRSRLRKRRMIRQGVDGQTSGTSRVRGLGSSPSVPSMSNPGSTSNESGSRTSLYYRSETPEAVSQPSFFNYR